MGSSSLEITLIDLVNGLYRKIDSIYTFEIGGDHFTDVIVNVLVEEFKRFALYISYNLNYYII